MLQFYISDNDGVYGLNFDDPTRQDFFRVIYFEEVNEYIPFVNDFSFINEGEDFMPFNHESELNFMLDQQVVTTGDFQFEKIMGVDAMDFVDRAFENEDDALGIMWGDCGVANFFVREEDLIRLDFTMGLYNWDCC